MIYNKPNTFYFKTAQVLLKDAEDILRVATLLMKAVKLHPNTGFLDVSADVFHQYSTVDSSYKSFVATLPSLPKKGRHRPHRSDVLSDIGKNQKKPFHHGDLVWAKMTGFPWYPSEIIDPTIGSPTVIKEMLATRPFDTQNKEEGPSHYLVVFFDRPEGKRTWAWLTKDHLILLGKNSEHDAMFLGFLKRHQRKAVRHAYARAMEQLHQRCM